MKRVLMCICLLRMSDAIESAGGEDPQPEVDNGATAPLPAEETPTAPVEEASAPVEEETFLEKVEDKLEEIGEEIKEGVEHVVEEVKEFFEGKEENTTTDTQSEEV